MTGLEHCTVTFHPRPLRLAYSGFGRNGREGRQLSGREESPDAVALVAAADARIQEAADSKGRQKEMHFTSSSGQIFPPVQYSYSLSIWAESRESLLKKSNTKHELLPQEILTRVGMGIRDAASTSQERVGLVEANQSRRFHGVI